MTKYAEDILRLAEEGKSYREIQSILGCSKGAIAYHLGKGQKEKTYNRQLEARKKINDYKESKPCTDCKINYPYYVMHFDHLPEFEKISHINYMRGGSWEKIQSEIDKCELVCANCHAIRTYKRSTVRNVTNVKDDNEFQR